MFLIHQQRRGSLHSVSRARREGARPSCYCLAMQKRTQWPAPARSSRGVSRVRSSNGVHQSEARIVCATVNRAATRSTRSPSFGDAVGPTFQEELIQHCYTLLRVGRSHTHCRLELYLAVLCAMWEPHTNASGRDQEHSPSPTPFIRVLIKSTHISLDIAAQKHLHHLRWLGLN